MTQEPASNGCSQPQRLAPKWGAPTRSPPASASPRPMSHNHCATVLGIPSSMSRGLDHIVHAVRDLDAAAAFYRRLGFTVGAANRPSWGPHNQVVPLPGFFI